MTTRTANLTAFTQQGYHSQTHSTAAAAATDSSPHRSFSQDCHTVTATASAVSPSAVAMQRSAAATATTPHAATAAMVTSVCGSDAAATPCPGLPLHPRTRHSWTACINLLHNGCSVFTPSAAMASPECLTSQHVSLPRVDTASPAIPVSCACTLNQSYFIISSPSMTPANNTITSSHLSASSHLVGSHGREGRGSICLAPKPKHPPRRHGR